LVKVEVFTAGSNLEVSRDFIVGHQKVLHVFDIANITSASVDWAFSNNSYIITIKRYPEDKIIGGARLQISNAESVLPIEDAVGEMDDDVFQYISSLRNEGVAEVCGLWNTREAAKLGIGSTFLTRAALTVASQIKIKALVMLCAPSTVSMATNLGAKIIAELGNSGRFYYPKLDLVATAMIKTDIFDLSNVILEEREIINSLRVNPTQVQNNKSKNGTITEIEYDLRIK
jgi:hypothetical protein